MADRPTRPTVPAAPSRLEPSTFSDRADAFVAFMAGAMLTYLENSMTYTDQRAGDAMAAAIAGDINSLDLSQFAGRAIGVDAGGTMLTGIVFQALVKATADVARAGTDDDDYMTALQTKTAIDQFGSALWEHIATKEANGDANLAFDEFDSSRYVDYEFIFRNILPQTDNQTLEIYPSDDGGSTRTSVTPDGDLVENVGNAANEVGISGRVFIADLHADRGALAVTRLAYVNNGGALRGPTNEVFRLQRPSVDGPIDYIRFEFAAGNIASGQISLYGLPDRS